MSMMRSMSGHSENLRLGGGANQTGARAYNDRLVLSLIRQAGALPKAELARMTGLSAQTLTVIVKRLESEGLLLPTARIRGRVGQPSVPYALNPGGAYSFGLKIGRRSAEVVLSDFTGAILQRSVLNYRIPTPDRTLAFAEAEIARIRGQLPPVQERRIIGVGIAMPFDIWNWKDATGEDTSGLDAWKTVDVEDAIASATGLFVVMANDATAACAAQLLASHERPYADFLYIYVGWFIGGGLVLEGSLYPGRRGNSAAIGSIPITGPDGTRQALQIASLSTLDEATRRAFRSPQALQRLIRDRDEAGPMARWLDQSAGVIARIVANGSAMLDLQAAYVDGAFPPAFRDVLIEKTAEAYARLDRRGLSEIEIVPGSIGEGARAMGAAILPILARYSRDSGVLLKAL